MGREGEIEMQRVCYVQTQRGQHCLHLFLLMPLPILHKSFLSTHQRVLVWPLPCVAVDTHTMLLWGFSVQYQWVCLPLPAAAGLLLLSVNSLLSLMMTKMRKMINRAVVSTSLKHVNDDSIRYVSVMFRNPLLHPPLTSHPCHKHTLFLLQYLRSAFTHTYFNHLNTWSSRLSNQTNSVWNDIISARQRTLYYPGLRGSKTWNSAFIQSEIKFHHIAYHIPKAQAVSIINK